MTCVLHAVALTTAGWHHNTNHSCHNYTCHTETEISAMQQKSWFIFSLLSLPLHPLLLIAREGGDSPTLCSTQIFLDTPITHSNESLLLFSSCSETKWSKRRWFGASRGENRADHCTASRSDSFKRLGFISLAGCGRLAKNGERKEENTAGGRFCLLRGDKGDRTQTNGRGQKEGEKERERERVSSSVSMAVFR